MACWESRQVSLPSAVLLLAFADFVVQDTSSRESSLDSIIHSSNAAFDLSVQYDTKRMFKAWPEKLPLADPPMIGASTRKRIEAMFYHLLTRTMSTTSLLIHNIKSHWPENKQYLI